MQLPSVAHVAFDHPMIEIECSDRNETPKKNVRDFVDGVIPFFRALEHEDCVARAIGCIGRLVNVIDENQPLPGSASRISIRSGKPDFALAT